MCIVAYRFSKECSLDHDNTVRCHNCPPEYTGRQCERCAPGYEGDPTRLGDYCKPAGQKCDPRGSLTLNPDPNTGLCTCKVRNQAKLILLLYYYYYYYFIILLYYCYYYYYCIIILISSYYFLW